MNISDDEFEKMEKKFEDNLKPLLTDEWLIILSEVAKVYGHSGDHIETMYFVRWCFGLADKEIPSYDDLKPYMESYLQ